MNISNEKPPVLCCCNLSKGVVAVWMVLIHTGWLANSVIADEAKPNFLFVMVDDMAPDAIFHNRFDFLKTPNLQRLAYEESIRVPFAMRYPPILKEGSRINRMVTNIDIGPTLLVLAGASLPETMQGESFVPVMEGKREGRVAPFFYEYFQEEYAPGIPTMLSIRTPDWKYISFPYESAEAGNFGELYHLGKDPKELKNVIHSPEAKTQLDKMAKLLEQAKKQYGYAEPPYKYEPTENADGK